MRRIGKWTTILVIYVRCCGGTPQQRESREPGLLTLGLTLEVSTVSHLGSTTIVGAIVGIGFRQYPIQESREKQIS